MLSNPAPPSTVVLYFHNCEWSTWGVRGSPILSTTTKILNLFTGHHKPPEGFQATPLSTQDPQAEKEYWWQCWQLFHLNIYTKHDLSFNKRQFLGGILKWSEEMKQSWWFIENASFVQFFLFLSMFQRPISQKHTFGKTWGTLDSGIW